MKSIKYILLFSIIITNAIPLHLDAQSVELGGFSDYQIVSLSDLVPSNRKSTDLIKHLDLAEYGQFELNLHDTRVIERDYILTIQDKEGRKQVPSSTTKTYIGNVVGIPRSTVAISVDKDFLYGFIRTPAEEFNIEPLRYYKKDAGKDELLVYKTKAQKKSRHIGCGVTAKSKEFIKNISTKVKRPKSLQGCVVVDIAVASDYTMFKEYGSVKEVEMQIIAMLNTVQTNYDTEFEDEIRFRIVEQFISTCESCDPWLPTSNATELLRSFKDWTKDGWESEQVDQSSFWSFRDFVNEGNRGSNGLSYVGTLCTQWSSAIMEEGDTGERKRVLWAHELGHNFGVYNHDSLQNYIMSSPLVESNQWSPESHKIISAFYPTKDCLNSCDRADNVIARFDHEYIGMCAPLNVQYNNTSQGEIDSLMWTFAGGTPTFSRDNNPKVTYNYDGIFDVTLQIFGSNGTTDIIEFRDLIDVEQIPDAEYQYSVMDKFQVKFIVINPLRHTLYEWDFGDGNLITGTDALHQFESDIVQKVTLTATNDCGFTTITEPVSFEQMSRPVADFSAEDQSICPGGSVQFNDLTQDSDSLSWFFEGGEPFNTSERNPVITYNETGLYSVGLIAHNAFGIDTITVSSFILVDPFTQAGFTHQTEGKQVSFKNSSSLARAILWDFGDGNTSEEIDPVHVYSEAGDYTVSLISGNFCNQDTATIQISIESQLPTAAYSPSTNEVCEGEQVQFTHSAVNASAFNWSFPGGTPSRSTDPNPSVSYNEPGTFDVSLTVTNEDGEQTIQNENQINVNQLPISEFSYVVDALTISFTSNAENATQHNWSFGDGTTSTDINPTHSYETSGELTITLTTQNSCGESSVSKTVNLESLEPSVSYVLSSQEICTEESISFTSSATNVESYSWEFEGGTPSTSSEANPVVRYDSPGSFDVTLIATNGEKEIVLSNDNQILVNPSPVSDFSYTVSGQTVNFTSQSTNADSHNWNFGDGSTSNETNPSYTFSSGGGITVSLITQNSCGESDISKTINIQSIVPSISYDISSGAICIGERVRYTSAGLDVETYAWEFEGGTPSRSSSPNPEITYENPGVFNVKLTVFNGEQQVIINNEDQISVGALPSANFNLIRSGKTVNLINNSANASSFIWDLGDGSTSTNSVLAHTFERGGNYTITLTAFNACGSDQRTRNIEIAVSVPRANFSSDLFNVCAGTQINFSNLSQNAESVQWFIEGGTPNSSTENNPTIQFNQRGVFDVTLVASNADGTDTLTFVDYITIEEESIVDFAYQQDREEVTFTSLSTFAESYFWDFGDGTISTEQNPIHSYALIDSIPVVTHRTSNICGIREISKQISLNTTLEIVTDFSLSAASMCAGDSIELVNQSTETERVEWYVGVEEIPVNEQNPFITLDNPGGYDVTMLAYRLVDGIEKIDTLVKPNAITVNDLPIADFTFARKEGDQVQFINLSENADSYLWNFGDQFGSNEENPLHAYNDQDEYIVTLVANSGCSSNTIQKTVNVKNIHEPDARFSVSGLVACSGSNIVFTAIGQGVDSYEWFFEGGSIETSNDAAVNIRYNDIGVFDVGLIVNNINGSDTNYIEDIITVQTKPTINFDYKIENNIVEFTPSGFVSGNINWDFGDGTNSSELKPTHVYPQVGDYIARLTYQASCGPVVISKVIRIVNQIVLPDARFSISSLAVVEGGDIRFASVSTETDNVSWYFEGGNPEFSDEMRNTVRYNTAGLYDVQLIARNEFGTDTLTLRDFITVVRPAFSSTESRSSLNSNEDITSSISKIYPNPYTDNFYVSIDPEMSGDVTISLYDAIGSKVYQSSFFKVKGQATLDISAPDLISGTYFARLIIGDKLFQQKIVKR